MALPENPQPEPQPIPVVEVAHKNEPVDFRRYLWRGKIGPAFWTVASVFSLTVNILLIVILVLVAMQLFAIKKLVQDQLIGGLYTNFVRMDQAHIVTSIDVKDTINVKDTIYVKDSIPVVFNLPLKQATTVTLTGNTPVKNATIYLNGAAVPLDLVLKQGTQLSIALDLTVPVSTTVPVNLTVPVDLKVPVSMKVPVDIPLNQTDLHQPFTGLQNVVSPYQGLLNSLPNSWNETPLCSGFKGWLCRWIFSNP